MTTAAWILRGAMNSGLQRWTGVLQVPSHHRFRFINCKIPSNESFLESRSSLKHSCGRPHSTVRSQSTPIDTSFLYFVFESVALNLNLKAHFSLYHSYSFRLFFEAHLGSDRRSCRVVRMRLSALLPTQRKLYTIPNSNSRQVQGENSCQNRFAETESSIEYWNSGWGEKEIAKASKN